MDERWCIWRSLSAAVHVHVITLTAQRTEAVYMSIPVDGLKRYFFYSEGNL
jgi:hypothetical protein